MVLHLPDGVKQTVVSRRRGRSSRRSRRGQSLLRHGRGSGGRVCRRLLWRERKLELKGDMIVLWGDTFETTSALAQPYLSKKAMDFRTSNRGIFHWFKFCWVCLEYCSSIHQ